MAEKKKATDGDEPLTAGGIFDQALAHTELPKREDRSLDDYIDSFTHPETRRRVAEAVSHARAGDVAALRHWLFQATDSFLRSNFPGKSDRHV